MQAFLSESKKHLKRKNWKKCAWKGSGFADQPYTKNTRTELESNGIIDESFRLKQNSYCLYLLITLTR